MKQYIEFYNCEQAGINGNSAPVLNSLRKEALKVVSKTSLPKLGDENYHITDLHKLFEGNYGINSNRLNIPTDVTEAFRCDVPNLSTLLFYVVNDTFVHSKQSPRIPEGVIVESLCKAAKDYPELVEKHYGKYAPMANPQVALNTLLAQDGLFVYIPDNVVLEKPVQVVNIANSMVPMMVNRRVLVVAGRNAQAKLLLCDHTQKNSAEMLINQVIEVVASENSVIDIYDMEESAPNTTRVSSLFSKQMDSSNLLVNNITLMNGTTRNSTDINIAGTNAETQLYGMAICQGKQIVDNYTFIGHNTPHCNSRELFKYLLDDDAKSCFGGKIYVAEGADKIEAYQSNNNIIASENAKMYTKPQLEIYTDDVKCSHGATIGQLDQNALFYMRTRGISEKEAKKLLMQAFMEDIIAKVRLEALHDRLRMLVEKRLSGDSYQCSDCGLKCGK